MKTAIITINELKRSNLQAILSLLIKSEGLSRVEIAQKLHCDNTTVTRAVRELMSHGLICPGRKKEAACGRPRTVLQINSDGPLFIGISFEEDRLSGIITDLHSKILRKDQILFEYQPSKEVFLKAAEKIFKQMIRTAGGAVAGIGASVFGSYSGADFTLRNVAAMPELNGIKLKPLLAQCAGRDVFICDHMVAKMHYMTRYFPDLNQGNILLISAGEGIGNVMIQNGHLLLSRGNHGGEFGHSIYVPNGKTCACGRKGCLETVVSIKAMLNQFRSRKKDSALSFPQFIRAFQTDDPDAVSVVKAASELFGTAISNQLNNYSFDRLIITGKILSLGKKFCSCLEEHIRANAFPIALDNLNISFLPVDADDYLACGVSIQLAEQFISRLEHY